MNDAAEPRRLRTVRMPGVAAAADQLARAADLGHGDEDMAAVYLTLKP